MDGRSPLQSLASTPRGVSAMVQRLILISPLDPILDLLEDSSHESFRQIGGLCDLHDPVTLEPHLDHLAMVWRQSLQGPLEIDPLCLQVMRQPSIEPPTMRSLRSPSRVHQMKQP